MSELTQRKIIGWTLALVLALGGIEIRLFLMPPSTVAKALAMAHKSRLPAGVSKGSLSERVLVDVADEILDFKLSCNRKLTQINAGDARQIRVHYEACTKEDDGYRLSSIVNETNHYQATIFDLDSSKQTSDFIPLKEGSNHIKMKLTNGEKQTSEQEYVFNRSMAKSPVH